MTERGEEKRPGGYVAAKHPFGTMKNEQLYQQRSWIPDAWVSLAFLQQQNGCVHTVSFRGFWQQSCYLVSILHANEACTETILPMAVDE